MRRRLSYGFALSVALTVPSIALALDPPAPKEQKSALKVIIDRSKVDLPGHKLTVKLSRTAEKVTLKVVGESGATLANVEKPFKGAPAGTPLEMSWTPSSEETIAKVEVWGYDTDGYYAG